MAVNGLFTYEDLYAGHSPNYHQRPIHQVSSSSSLASNQLLTALDTSPLTTTVVPTSYFSKLVLSTEIESSTKPNKLADVIPFTYFYWLLVVLAILLTLTLIIVFIYYCRTFFRNYKNRRDSFASFHRYRPANRRVHTNKIYKPPVSPQPSLPTPPCPSKSLESLNNQLHRQDHDLGMSPPTARLDLYLKEPLSTFSSSTSNLHSGLQSRLSARSSDLPIKVDLSYESQRASMALDDEDKNDSLTIDIN